MRKITDQTRYKKCFVEGAATEWRRQQICTFPILTIRESLHTHDMHQALFYHIDRVVVCRTVPIRGSAVPIYLQNVFVLSSCSKTEREI